MDLQQKAEEAQRSFELAKEAAIDAPGAMQSKSDTTKFQMSRLAESYMNTYQQIQDCILSLEKMELPKNCNTVSIGSIVRIEENESKDYYFILPSNCGSCGGQTIEIERQKVIIVSIQSPIAQALINKKVGDKANVKTPSGLRTFRIVEIA